MSSPRETEIILNLRNKIEYTLFNKDGMVNTEILGQVGCCPTEQNEIFG